jgi:hypothetical protein
MGEATSLEIPLPTRKWLIAQFTKVGRAKPEFEDGVEERLGWPLPSGEPPMIALAGDAVSANEHAAASATDGNRVKLTVVLAEAGVSGFRFT